MRLLVLLFGMFCATLSGAGASETSHAAAPGESPHTLLQKKLELKPTPNKPRFRCAKKIPLGPDKSEVACLMQKRDLFAASPGAKAAPEKRETSGRDQERKPSEKR